MSLAIGHVIRWMKIIVIASKVGKYMTSQSSLPVHDDQWWGYGMGNYIFTNELIYIVHVLIAMVVNKWRLWGKRVMMWFNSIIAFNVVRKWEDENACWNFESSQTIAVMSIYKNVKQLAAASIPMPMHTDPVDLQIVRATLLLCCLLRSHMTVASVDRWLCATCVPADDWLTTQCHMKYGDDALCITMK